ncbi:terpenoid synthase [Gloeophyllum trabeum ATCC 11539]|uniref:Terpene synthase n=1 Tax=Gloeophyllum trabeum (strain ATCC 11539 / FP-39264 / Madison 617) TaxID=670483 RepID=S7RHW2_GLOTA|nr:terpenoid synthase [Gloeophyllum trabeum ATCC 11539]EPQ52189.1 terpenoid synthase [Gloeophyllum trabeum ATCC 11539]
MSTSKPAPTQLAHPAKIIMPDLVSHCDFKLRINRHHRQAAVASERWMFKGGNLDEQGRTAFRGLKAGLLTSMCYPDAAYPQLKVCCDYMNYLFHLDNLTDDMDNSGARNVRDEVMGALRHPESFQVSAKVGRMTRDYWRRFIQTGSKGSQERFIQTFDDFFHAVFQQAIDRKNGVVPDLESYITLRRDTSGCRPCFALIEYANNLHLPDEVMSHPIIRSLEDASNDLVTWSNDIFSYNVEQARGDTHNMIVVVMREQGMSLQEAFDFVGMMCKQSIDRFIADRDNLPSWGPEIDRQIDVYVDGLANWIVGSLHWTFESTRYFGNNGKDVKANRIITLLPKCA